MLPRSDPIAASEHLVEEVAFARVGRVLTPVEVGSVVHVAMKLGSSAAGLRSGSSSRLSIPAPVSIQVCAMGALVLEAARQASLVLQLSPLRGMSRSGIYGAEFQRAHARYVGEHALAK